MSFTAYNRLWFLCGFTAGECYECRREGSWRVINYDIASDAVIYVGELAIFHVQPNLVILSHSVSMKDKFMPPFCVCTVVKLAKLSLRHIVMC